MWFCFLLHATFSVLTGPGSIFGGFRFFFGSTWQACCSQDGSQLEASDKEQFFTFIQVAPELGAEMQTSGLSLQNLACCGCSLEMPAQLQLQCSLVGAWVDAFRTLNDNSTDQLLQTFPLAMFSSELLRLALLCMFRTELWIGGLFFLSEEVKRRIGIRQYRIFYVLITSKFFCF